jgi:hypothetical protein
LYNEPQEKKMGTLATIKFVLFIALVILGALFAAFVSYMLTFGRRSSLHQKSITETDDI